MTENKSPGIETDLAVDVLFTISREHEVNVYHVEGAITVFLDDDDEPTTIGKTTGVWMPNASLFSIDDTRDLSEALDVVSQELLDASQSTESFLLLNDFHSMTKSWLYVQWVELDEKYRGHRLSYKVMHEWMRCFGSEAFVVARPNGKIGSVPFEKTKKHWEAFGFLSHDEHLFIDRTFVLPEWTWMGANDSDSFFINMSENQPTEQPIEKPLLSIVPSKKDI